jgi:L-lysine 2,3-aminomutase
MQCDAVAGTAHLRVSIRRGVAIMAALRGWISGLGIPTYVLDLPGGAGKVPLGPGHVETREDDVLVLRGPRGEIVRYADPLSDDSRCAQCTCPSRGTEPGEVTDWTPAKAESAEST